MAYLIGNMVVPLGEDPAEKKQRKASLGSFDPNCFTDPRRPAAKAQGSAPKPKP